MCRKFYNTFFILYKITALRNDRQNDHQIHENVMKIWWWKYDENRFKIEGQNRQTLSLKLIISCSIQY